MSKVEKILLTVNIIIYLFLCVFSYAFVDLNLTISQNHSFLAFVGAMQFLGYYNRPLSVFIYTLFLIVAFGFFITTLFLISRHKIGIRYVFLSTGINILILVFAYPYLSADIFNYMFDAKIIATYNSNPYTNRPLDFPGDDWLRFMRWVHRYSPYGPLWLGFSLIPYLLGFGKFVLTLLSFKFFISIFHLVNSLLIYEIVKKSTPQKAIFATALYSLNPLFLIEGIANAHNDVMLAAFFIGSLYFMIYSKKTFALALLIIGVFIKYIPLLALPWIAMTIFFKKLNFSRLIWLNLITMSAFTFIYSTVGIAVPFVNSGSTQVQFQPWYLFWTLPFISLLNSNLLVALTIAFSLGASLRYLPFIYFGDWSQLGTLEFMKIVTLLPAAIVTIYFLVSKRILGNK